MPANVVSRTALIILALVLLTGCAVRSNLSSPQADTRIELQLREFEMLPHSDLFAATSAGNFAFAAHAPSYDSMYGLIPLKINKGFLIMDLVFFPPAILLNLRGMYAYYDFDLAQGMVRYRQSVRDPWQTYVPTTADAEVARHRLEADYLR